MRISWKDSACATTLNARIDAHGIGKYCISQSEQSSFILSKFMWEFFSM